MGWFKFIMFFVWVAAMMLACWAFEVARIFARRVSKQAQLLDQRTPQQKPVEASPGVAVILPIKGVEEGTEENIQALLAQEYPNCRLIFAVESADDPAAALLERMSREKTVATRIETVVAGQAATRGQKIQNQLAAIERTTDTDEILAFVDADARPKPYWLRELVGPLTDPAVGATTGFRYYVPAEGGSPCADPPHDNPSAIACVINAAVAALLGPGWRNIAWGGSMAVRRAEFFSLGIHDAWQNALSDDYVLSWCVRKARRRIQFVQACLVPSIADFTWPGFWEFAARQYRITRICAPGVWLTATGAALLYLIGLAYTILFWLLSVTGILPADSPTGRVDHLLLVMFLALYVANVLRGWFLLQGGMVALPAQAEQLWKARFWFTLGYPLTLAVNLLALLKSAFGRTLEWRGVRYCMLDRLRTTVHRPAGTSAPASPASTASCSAA